MPAIISDSKSSVKTDPLRNFRFQVNINHKIGGQNIGTRLGFMSVSGLSQETSVVAYREGQMNTTALPLTERVLTTNGWKLMGDIEVGDRMVDPRGEDSKVVYISPVVTKDVYRVTMQDGSTTDACYGHLWEIQTRDSNNRKVTEIVSTLEMKERVDKQYWQVLLPKMEPFQYDVGPELPLDPWLLGLLLAEGSFEESTTFSSGDPEIVERVRSLLPEGHSLRQDDEFGYAISVGNNGGAQAARNVVGRNLITAAIRELGLTGRRAWDKFIPEVYLRASIEDRQELLRGYLDGDGSIKEDGNIRVSSSSPELASNVRELILSLGGRCKIVHITGKTYVYNGARVPCRDEYRINGIGGLTTNPFWLPRKAEHFREVPSTKSDSYFRKVVSVDLIGQDEVQCIEVSASSHLFISGDGVPSHNTQKMPGQTDFPPLTVARGLMVGKPQQLLWLKEYFSVVAGQGTSTPDGEFRGDLDIYLLAHPWTSSNKVPVKAKFHVFNCWPTSVAFGDFDAGANAIMMEQMVLQHEGFGVVTAVDNGTSDVTNATKY